MLPFARAYVKSEAHQQATDMKVEMMQKEMQELRAQLQALKGEKITQNKITITDAIYEIYKDQLEREHMDEIVAFDIETKQIAGYGSTVREAYDNARRKFNKEQFYLKRVGSRYLHRL